MFSRSFHQYSWNSEVETTWKSLICWRHRTSIVYGFATLLSIPDWKLYLVLRRVKIHTWLHSCMYFNSPQNKIQFSIWNGEKRVKSINNQVLHDLILAKINPSNSRSPCFYKMGWNQSWSSIFLLLLQFQISLDAKQGDCRKEPRRDPLCTKTKINQNS